MSELRLSTLEMPAADLGPENPLPSLALPPRGTGPKFDSSVPESERLHFGYGHVAGCLPHRVQDQYDRRKRPRALKTAVLENEILRAIFLLEYGGRLWSLVHKPSGRELLYVNPVFQPANLAVRDAWFSGGVEWNVGVRGHTPCTCSPLFAAEVDGGPGNPVLRLWEWDRIRCTPYQMDFSLPDGSAWLFVRVRIVNPAETETPMYWWSNIAAPEQTDVRVLVPADHALHGDPGKGLLYIPVPECEGLDRTYSTNITKSGDAFYCIPEERRPWIAALDGQGRGLVQLSTGRLRGRKLWNWGMGAGGRRWQEFLSVPDRPYIELQAGLARTQGQCLPMPPRSEWTWLEAYGLMEAAPARVHGKDWSDARRAVEERLDRELPAAWMEATLARTDAVARRAPRSILQHGSGWGALELRRREAFGEPPFCGPEMPFDTASLGADQTPWLALLNGKRFAAAPPDQPPGAWMVQPHWRRLLKEAASEKASDHWLSWLHLGVMAYHDGDTAEAVEAWQRSLRLTRSPWALRNLAVQARRDGRKAEAAAHMREACAMLPTLLPLVIECMDTQIDAAQPAEALKLLPGLPATVRENGRVRILTARAAIEVGELDCAEAILRDRIEIINLREGELTLTDLWFSLHERRIARAEGHSVDDALRQRVRRDFPPPPHLDFRMFG